MDRRTSLLRKYNVPAPRYTSYPTVPYWETTPSEDEWIELLASAMTDHAGAALYIHIPFCEQMCTFCGCNTRITKNHDVGMPYIKLVHREWELYKASLGTTSPLMHLSELHLGGGTPTFLNPEELMILVEPLLNDVQINADAEFGVEVDPRVTTKAHLQALRHLGFNRISMGIQDFDPKVQQTINRIQSFEMVRELSSTARQLNYKSLNFDLIYGLPFQSEASMLDTFRAVTELRPDRVAFYAYAHVPWIKPAHRRFSEEDLPQPALKRRLYELGRSLMEEAGYVEIGMDHFALRTDELWTSSQQGTLHRNFMGYMPHHVSPQLGLGVSSISDSWTAFVQNEKSLEKYKARIDEGRLPLLRGHVLSAEDLVLRRHILNLMTKFESSWSEDEQNYLCGVEDRLSELVKDELIELSPGHIRVKDEGRAFLRNVSMAFDARLLRRTPQTEIFSRSI